MAYGAKDTSLRYKYNKISASTLIKTGQGVLHRIVVTASSSGVITVYDNTAGSGTKIIDALAVAAKDMIELNAWFTTGCYVNIDSGTATLTVLNA